MRGHTACYSVTVVLTLFMVISGAVVHLIDWWDAGVKWNIFDQREDTVWAAYENARHDLRFYYTKWIFFMWVITYITQLCWTFYGLELICRKTKTGSLYHNVPIVPSIVFIMMAAVAATILIWLFLWTSIKYFKFAPLSMLVATVCCYLSLALSVGSLSQNLHILYGLSAYRYIWEIRILVHNGLGIAASWTTVVLFYCSVIVLEDNSILPAGKGGFVFLSLLGAYLIVWFFLDISLAKKYIPHLVTPYFVFIVVEVQVLLKSGLEFNYHFIYSIVLLVLTVVLTLIRLAVAVGLSTRRWATL